MKKSSVIFSHNINLYYFKLNQDIKEAIRAKKDAFKVLLQSKSSSDLQSRYSEIRKTAAQAVKMSKECS